MGTRVPCARRRRTTTETARDRGARRHGGRDRERHSGRAAGRRDANRIGRTAPGQGRAPAGASVSRGAAAPVPARNAGAQASLGAETERAEGEHPADAGRDLERHDGDRSCDGSRCAAVGSTSPSRGASWRDDGVAPARRRLGCLRGRRLVPSGSSRALTLVRLRLERRA